MNRRWSPWHVSFKNSQNTLHGICTWMIQILSLQTDATVFTLQRTTALRKTPPFAPEFVILYVTAFCVQVMPIPAQADGDEHYGWYQVGLLLLLKTCASSSTRRIPICSDTSNGQNQANAEYYLPLEISLTNIWAKSQCPTCMYSSKNVFGSKHFSLTSSGISSYFSASSWGAADTLSRRVIAFQSFKASVK